MPIDAALNDVQREIGDNETRTSGHEHPTAFEGLALTLDEKNGVCPQLGD